MAEASKENEEKNVGRGNSFSRLLLSPMRSSSSKTKRTSSSKSFRRFFGSKKRDEGDDSSVRNDEPSFPEPEKEVVQDVIDMAQEGPLAHKDEASSLAKSVTSSTDNFIERTMKILDDSKNELKDKANEGIETANKSLEDVKETANKSLEDVKETANKSLGEAQEIAQRSFENAKETANKSLDNAKESAHRSLDHAKEKAQRSLGSFMDKFKHKENKPQEVVQQKVEEKDTIDENKEPLAPLPGQLEKIGHISHVSEEVGLLVDTYIADQSSNKVTGESLSKEGEGNVAEEKEVVLEREDNCVTSLAQGLNNICASWSKKKED